MFNSLDAYIDKNKHLSTYAEQVSPYEFYRDMFPEGSFERAGHPEDNRPNGILLEIHKNSHNRRYTITDDLTALIQHRDSFSITAPIGYFGYERTAKNARELFALAFDIDGVDSMHLQNLMYQMDNEIIPRATYIVNSGGGVHLYYLLDTPAPMYPDYQRWIRDIKYALTVRLWNPYTSTLKKPQMQGITQGFRIVGSPSKLGVNHPVTAYSYGNRHSLNSLISFLPEGKGTPRESIEKSRPGSKLSLAEAKEKYPEWYERKIKNNNAQRNLWTVNTSLYDWWFRRIRAEITVGHRYYAIMCLAIYAEKCAIPFSQLKKDAYSLLPIYDALAIDESTRFTVQDLNAALSLYNPTARNYATFPRKEIEKLSGISIPANKRNYRPQELHMKLISSNRDILYPNGSWRGTGRPSVEHVVKEYLEAHPGATKKQIKDDTGLSYPTIRKYYPQQEKTP